MFAEGTHGPLRITTPSNDNSTETSVQSDEGTSTVVPSDSNE